MIYLVNCAPFIPLFLHLSGPKFKNCFCDYERGISKLGCILQDRLHGPLISLTVKYLLLAQKKSLEALVTLPNQLPRI